jgi:hypothetical protein
MTILENSLNTIDDDVEAIISDKDAALVARNSAQATAKQAPFGVMLGGA